MAGNYCPAGATAPVPCEEGNYCPTDNLCRPLPCSCTIGTCQGPGNVGPSPCFEGFHCTATSFIPCPDGDITVCPASGPVPEGLTCVGGNTGCGCKCNPGYCCDDASNIYFGTCKPKTTTAVNRLTTPAPSPCTYVDTNKKTKTCPAGYFCTKDHNKVVCPAGFYCPSSGLCSPLPCPCGKFCPEGTRKPQYCTDGHFCPSQSSAPVPCRGGFICRGKSTCTPTSAPCGFYAPAGSTALTQCPRGSYCPPQSSAPVPCPAGSYCPTGSRRWAGQCAPVPCPEGKVSAPGTVALSGCVASK